MTSVSGVGASPVSGAQQARPVERIPDSPLARAFSLLLQRSDVLEGLASDLAAKMKERVDRLAKARDVLADMRACKQDGTKWMSQEMHDFLLKYDIKADKDCYITESQTKDPWGKRYFNSNGDQILYDTKESRWKYGDKQCAEWRHEAAYDSDSKIGKDQWDVNIQYLQAKIDSWSTESSVDSEDLKGLVSKQNESTDGANSFASQLHESGSGLRGVW